MTRNPVVDIRLFFRRCLMCGGTGLRAIPNSRDGSGTSRRPGLVAGNRGVSWTPGSGTLFFQDLLSFMCLCVLGA